MKTEDEYIKLDTDFCCSDDVCSYNLKASRLLCPVHSLISFSGTFASNKQVAPVAQSEFPSIPTA